MRFLVDRRLLLVAVGLPLLFGGVRAAENIATLRGATPLAEQPAAPVIPKTYTSDRRRGLLRQRRCAP